MKDYHQGCQDCEKERRPDLMWEDTGRQGVGEAGARESEGDKWLRGVPDGGVWLRVLKIAALLAVFKRSSRPSLFRCRRPRGT